MFRKPNLRYISTFSTLSKESSINLKGKKGSSRDWLTRQMKDPYVEKAKLNNYRCRSAFKLIEIDDKYKFLTPGCTVVDCGASPGSWTQVAIQRCNADGKDVDAEKGTVVGIDLLKIHPLPGAIFLCPADFTSKDTQKELLEVLNGKLVDVFMSDMAPNAAGVSQLDHECISNLVIQALRFALPISKPGGTFLAKLWHGNQMNPIKQELERFYGNVSIVKPPSSRKDSAEIFLLSRGFKGLKKQP